MFAYKTLLGWIIETAQGCYHLHDHTWNNWMNASQMVPDAATIANSFKSIDLPDEKNWLAPIEQQELWACGVTYIRSREGRREESEKSGAADFYTKVYDAERPEIFFKANPSRIRSHLEKVRIRRDSNWNVPEPELTLVVNAAGSIIGYTIGNDMSSRSIEGENPLYLPQAKVYDGSASIGPRIWLPPSPISSSTIISLNIFRNTELIFDGVTTLQQMKRSLEELVAYVYKECSFNNGCYIMTGTGIVPPKGFTLQTGDIIEISIEGIGKLLNTVE